MTTATVSISVPALPENDIWFANAQAWNNYWKNLSATIEIQALATTTLYVPGTFNSSLPVYNLVIDGVECVVVSKAMFDSLRDMVINLESSYQLLRTELREAGIITDAQ